MAEVEWRAFVADAPYSEPFKERYYKGRLAAGSEVVIGYSPGHPWMDVFARKRRRDDPRGCATGEYGLYGFHSEWSRWSFGAGPVGAREIRDLLRILVPTIRDRES